MTDSTWPEEPYHRKTVLVLNQTDIDALRYEEGGPELLLNEEVYILPFSSKESNPVVQYLLDSGLASLGAVLIQNPFDKDVYENSKEAVERFALDKHQHFSALCGFLGARKVTVEQIEYKNTESREIWSFNIDLPIEGMSVGVGEKIEIQEEELASFQSKLELEATFQGSSPDVPAAEKHLRQRGLLGDVDMRSLLDMRRNPNNLLTSQKLQLNMTSEVRRNFNVLAQLNVPTFLDLEAGYDRPVHEQTEFTLTVRVDF